MLYRCSFLFLSLITQKSYQKHYDKFNKPLQLDINVVETSGKDGSRALLLKNEEESDKDLNTKGIPKAVSTSVSLCALSTESASNGKEHAIDAQTDVRDRVENQYENDSMQASQDCQNNMERDENFTAKDLLSFAWQVARGMVCQVFSFGFLYDGLILVNPVKNMIPNVFRCGVGGGGGGGG